MLGSSLYIIHVVPELKTDSRYWAGPYLFKGAYMVASGMSTAGTLTRWFRDEITADFVKAQERGEGTAYDMLTNMIRDVRPGSEGLIVLPYFSGERTPINDPAAKGAFFGLTLNHTRAHLYHACLESVGYGIKQHLDGYGSIGMETKRIIAVGGGTKNPKWMQTICDIVGREMILGGVYGAAFGDALLAALGTGGISGIEELSKLIQFHGKLSPDLEHTKLYEPFVKWYTELYEATKTIMHQL